MSSVTVTIRMHAQLENMERERRERAGNYLSDRYVDIRKRAHASYLHKRDWTNSTKDRHNGGYKFCGPGWILPRVIATVTASIVWGVCGKMADMPEY